MVVEKLASMAGKRLLSMLSKYCEKKLLDKKIYDLFHNSFTFCDDRVGLLCDHRQAFREEMFSLAQGNIINVRTLIKEAKAHAGDTDDPLYAPPPICEHLEDFSRSLNNLYRKKVSQKLGEMPAGYAFFYLDVGRLCDGHIPRIEPINVQFHTGEAASPAWAPFYLPHRHNPLLRHFRTWMDKISDALAASNQAAISQPEHFRDLALYGLGGLGKTAMAVAYAYQHAERYPGGVFWLQADLGLSQALAELAKGLGWDLPDDLNDQQITQAVLARLQTRELKLLILDNQDEHVVPLEISQITDSHLLVTTRLSDVNVGGQVSMGLPAEEEALGIFLAYAQLEDADLSQAQAQAAYAICRRVGFLPLALEILGKNARSQSLPDLAEALEQAVVDKKATVLTKGQELSIAAALAVSGQKYSHPRAQEALLHLSYLHPEELSKEILALVMGVEEAEAQEMLVSLAQFSVVQPGAEGGYSMHRLVQEAARLEDEESGIGERVVDVLDAIIRKVSEKGAYQAAYPLIPHLLQIASLSRPEASEDIFPSNFTLARWGTFLSGSGRLEPSEKVMRAVLGRVEAAKGREHRDYATNLNNLAGVLVAQGNYPEAEKLFRQTLEIGENTIGKEHPSYAIRLNNLAEVLRAQGNYPEAEKLYRQALEIDEKTIGKQHPDYAIHLNNLALVQDAQGNYPEAEKLYRQAMEIDENTIGTEHPSYAIDLNNLAGVLRAQGKYPEAEKLYRQAIGIGEKTIGTEHPDYAKHLNNLAGVLREQGRQGEAVGPLQQAIAIGLKTLGAEHPQTELHQRNLEILLREMKD